MVAVGGGRWEWPWRVQHGPGGIQSPRVHHAKRERRFTPSGKGGYLGEVVVGRAGPGAGAGSAAWGFLMSAPNAPALQTAIAML